MLIAGSWSAFTDGIIRPVVEVRIQMGTGLLCAEWFLIDSGADATVLRAEVFAGLNLPAVTPPSGPGLIGVGGGSPFVLVDTTLVFTGTSGAIGHIQGRFAAFSAPNFSTTSILGRDVLDHFDLILSRRRDEVLLLRPDHQYQIVSP